MPGTVLRFDKPSRRYAKAQASSEDHARVVGVVRAHLDAKRFTLARHNDLLDNLKNLVPGAVYYLSPTVPGGVTMVRPSAFAREVFQAISETTALVLLNTLADDSSGSGSGDGSFALSNNLEQLDLLHDTGIVVRTAEDTWRTRTIRDVDGHTKVTNGDGISGDPTIDLDMSGVTDGTYGAADTVPQVTIDTYGRATVAVDVRIAIVATQVTDIVTAVGKSYEAENKEGSTISAGQAVATYSTGVGVVLASAVGLAKVCVGLMAADTLDTVAGTVQTEGVIELADWTAVTGSAALTRGPYYLDPATPGMLTATPPTTDGQILQVVGYAVSTTVLDMSIAQPILL